MTHHKLKTDPEVFQSSWENIKNFELRYNDRDYRPGDTLTLMETKYSGDEMSSGALLEYTGREIEQTINYILHGPKYGLQQAWVILSVDNDDYHEHEIQGGE